jgi:hypothetical protein
LVELELSTGSSLIAAVFLFISFYFSSSSHLFSADLVVRGVTAEMVVRWWFGDRFQI